MSEWLKKDKVDDLLNLVHKKQCSVDLLIHFLHTRFKEKGIRDYIINALYDIKIKEVLFYVPELCYMGLRHKNEFILKLVTEKSVQSSEFFILVFLLVVLVY